MADLVMKLSNIPPTFLREFLSQGEEDTLFLNDLKEAFFFSHLYFFSVQINCGLLRIYGSSLSLRWLQRSVSKTIHDIWDT